MNRFLSEVDIARVLGESLPDVRKALRNARLKQIQRQGRIVYSRDDVPNWISANFGSLATERLVRADHASADQGGLDPECCAITELLRGGRVFFPERVSTRPAVFRSLAGKAVELGAVYDENQLREQLQEREEVVSTALRCGAALVHPIDISKLYIEHELLLLMIPPHPVPFGESSGRLTSLFFLLLFPGPHLHVHVLARINRLLRSTEFIETLLGCQNQNQVLDAVEEREKDLVRPGVKD